MYTLGQDICERRFCDMKTIQIPYYTSTMDLHVEEKNLKALIYSGTDEFKAGKTEEDGGTPYSGNAYGCYLRHYGTVGIYLPVCGTAALSGACNPFGLPVFGALCYGPCR